MPLISKSDLFKATYIGSFDDKMSCYKLKQNTNSSSSLLKIVKIKWYK